MKAAQKDLDLATRIADHIDPKRDRISTFELLHSGAVRILRRAERTLHRWHELECGTDAGHIEEAVGPDGNTYHLFRPAGRMTSTGWVQPKGWPMRNTYGPAIKRVEAVCLTTNLHYYVQTDPRGCALYVSNKPLTAENYSRGVAIY